MDYTVTCSIQNGCIVAKIDAPEAVRGTQYAYYLYKSDTGLMEKRPYRDESECSFSVTCGGSYYVRGFVRYKEAPDQEYIKSAKNSNRVNYSAAELFCAMYQAHPIPAPKVYFHSAALVKVADKLLGGTLCVRHNLEEMPYCLETLDWNAQYGAQPGAFLLHLQGLTPVPALIGAYIQTKQLAYLQYAREFVEAWHRYIQDPDQVKNKYCWVDHAVNLRATTMIYLGQVAAQDGLWDDAFYAWLLERIKEHGACLNQDDTYAENHNNGVMQDQGLLYIAVFLQREDWINHAVERLMRQVKWAFNSEGVHKENSSGYAQQISQMFRSIGQFLLDAGTKRGQAILDAVSCGEDYLTWLTLPNGKLVQIGDTQLIKREIPVQKHGHKFYPDAGMYFYRSETGDDPSSATYKVVKAGYETTTHKHCDDLSFVLYSKGNEIFADSGVYGYARNKYRAYVLSALAHNTVIVDGTTYAATAENAAHIGMEGYRAFLGYDHVRLFQNAYPGVAITRDFCSADDLTILVDTVESQQNHVYSQLFHLAENIEVLQAQDHEVVLWLAYSGYTVRLRQYGSPVKLRVIKGDLSKPGYGLISQGTNHLAATTTLKFDMEGTSGSFITAITIENKDGDVRLGDRMARGESLIYNADTRSFAIGNLVIPYDRLLTPTTK